MRDDAAGATTTRDATSRPTASASVYERIRQAILTNAIAPDVKLNIDALARELGVSPTPVREALQRLEGDRLVVAKQPRGYWTTALLDERGLDQLFEVRLLLEPWAAGAAAVDRASNPGRRLRAEVDRFALARDAPSPETLVLHDSAFHQEILRSVDNPFLDEAYERTHAHLHLFRLYTDDMDAAVTVEEHRRIADAIAACDAPAATRAMRDHLLSALDRFGRGFDVARAARRLAGTSASVLGGHEREATR